jgi:hypothetical protein
MPSEGYYGVEDAIFVVRMMAVLGGKNHIAAFISYQILVEWGQQQRATFAKAMCTATVEQVKMAAFPKFNMRSFSPNSWMPLLQSVALSPDHHT